MALVADDELLEAQAHIWNQIFNFINSMSLTCALQLGIPDAIFHSHDDPMPLSQLVSALRLHPDKTPFVYRLMRILTHSGFFVSQKVTINGGDQQEQGYSLTNSSRLLLKHNPFSLTPFLLLQMEKAFFEPWHFLAAWFRSTEDRTPFVTVHGMSFWEHMGEKPRDGDIFNAAMASDARLVASVLVGKYKSVFDGVGSLVDVGGGTGTVAKAIAEAFPEMECVVFDVPQVVADLKGEKTNLTFVGGDMFQAIPSADALLLKWILHDWNDEECVRILKKCKSAITCNGNKGKVIVIDMVISNNKKDDSVETQLFWDMLMMVNVGGKEREEKEWAHLIKEAGFSIYKIFPILGLRSLIEIYP